MSRKKKWKASYDSGRKFRKDWEEQFTWKTARSREKEGELTKENKEMDLHISVFVAIHTVDHFGQVVRKHGEVSSLGKLKLGRTKCSALIKKVIAPTLKEELKENIHGKRATDKMFQLFTTDIMYSTKETPSGASNSTTERDDDGGDWLEMSEAQEDVGHAHTFF
ncbi:hypothetical protein RRG08_057970 [Elysia crispata]|uniref:Uncharacterized protein n=1 Tax=Elysia crispata TaxID=231223 RepID=A0AAE1BDV0_9GAST|nr:hypothetical protein RRG08_057970 [Elysia crispata]